MSNVKTVLHYPGGVTIRLKSSVYDESQTNTVGVNTITQYLTDEHSVSPDMAYAIALLCYPEDVWTKKMASASLEISHEDAVDQLNMLEIANPELVVGKWVD
ncbi:MAG: hypothetical protein WCG55_00760 [bacterium]